MKRSDLRFCICFWLLIASQSAVSAAVPRLINYQGKLASQEGIPFEGAKDITFRIYDAQNAGNLLWQEAHVGVIVQKGVFNILLGSIAALGLAFDKPYYLEIKVGEETMSPRQSITSAGYAIHAEMADDSLKFSGRTKDEFVSSADITVAPTANRAVKLDTNAKLPATALKIYDSGWFSISTNIAYTKTHNLGTTKALITVYGSNTSNGSGTVSIMPLYQHFDSANSHRGINIVSLTNTQVVLRGKGFLLRTWNSSGEDTDALNSCYVRIVMLALE
ncbi:MAG: hypothetical protein WC732_04075 [Candidatus Omnitrophota bacterium]